MDGRNDSAVTRYLSRLGAIACLLFLVLVVASPALADPQQYSADGTYNNPQGDCGQNNPFTSSFLVILDPAKQKTNMQIDQPSTGDSVRGAITPNGKFHLNNAEEDYRGTANGKTLKGTYTWTYNGCPTKWFFTLTLNNAITLPQAAVAEPEPDEETDAGGAATTEEEEPEQPAAAQPAGSNDAGKGLSGLAIAGIVGGAAVGGLVAYNALRKKDDEDESESEKPTPRPAGDPANNFGNWLAEGRPSARDVDPTQPFADSLAAGEWEDNDTPVLLTPVSPPAPVDEPSGMPPGMIYEHENSFGMPFGPSQPKPEVPDVQLRCKKCTYVGPVGNFIGRTCPECGSKDNFEEFHSSEDPMGEIEGPTVIA